MTLRKWFFLPFCCCTLLCITSSFIFPKAPPRTPCPIVTVGGGYWFAGSNHSGAIAQIEYRWNKYLLRCIRPQVTLALPELKGTFLGVGLGVELFLGNHWVLIPSFEPGLYIHGKSRDLGCPLEFRSCVELAYEMCNGYRLGCQIYHISNARLGNHNPGANALVFYLGIPTRICKKT